MGRPGPAEPVRVEVQGPDAGGEGAPHVGVDGVAHMHDPLGWHGPAFEGPGEDAGVGLFETGDRRVDDDHHRHALARPHLADPGGQELLLDGAVGVGDDTDRTPVAASRRRPSTEPGSTRRHTPRPFENPAQGGDHARYGGRRDAGLPGHAAVVGGPVNPPPASSSAMPA